MDKIEEGFVDWYEGGKNYDKFQKKSFWKRMEMSVNELNAYYRKKRQFEYEMGLPIKVKSFNRKIYYFFQKSLKFDRFLNGRTLTIVRDDRIDTGRSRIYATTHVGQNDVVSGWEAFGEQAYAIMGDPGDAYRSMEGFMIYLAGVIYMDTGWYTDDDGVVKYNPDCKLDRRICIQNCIEYLKQGANIYIFPEGAWNITANKLVQKLYMGAVNMAYYGNADIIPVAIDRVDKKNYTLSMGKNIKVDNKDDRIKTNDYLRDTLCTLKWELIERKGIVKRSTLEDYKTEYQKFVDDIMSETERGYTEDIIRASCWHDK